MHANDQEENTSMQNADKSIKRGRGRHSWRGPIMKRAHNNIHACEECYRLQRSIIGLLACIESIRELQACRRP
jgi:hypothetical protein